MTRKGEKMRTKTQKNFHKEMKRYEKKRKKSGQQEPLSYIYKEKNDYIPPTGGRMRIISYWFIFMVRVAFIIGLLSFTGLIDPILNRFKKEDLTTPIHQSLMNEQQILFNYLDKYDQYINKAHEIIERYNEGRLEEIEIYALQKVLIESVSFTEEAQNPLLVNLNDAIIIYHDNLISWLDTLVHPEQETINESILKLQGQQSQVMNELVKVFDQAGVTYHYNEDFSISYQRMSTKVE